MKRFTNENIKKEYKKSIRYTIIPAIFMLIGLVCWCLYLITGKDIPFILGTIYCLGTGGIIFLINLIALICFVISINKLDEAKVKELDNEMNNSNAVYYSEYHLYLTENYIIIFSYNVIIFKYSDILWMYICKEFIDPERNIEKYYILKVLLNNAKIYRIAKIGVIWHSPKEKKIFDGIWNIISSANRDMLLGYTTENIKAMNKKVKEIKKEKKNK